MSVKIWVATKPRARGSASFLLLLLTLTDERYGGAVRGRISAIRPGYYTGMGAALRYGTKLLEAQPATRRLLLLLSDGKPNDLDKYEGRCGIEDTRHAVLAARLPALYARLTGGA